MFGRDTLHQRKRLGCWFWIAVVAIALNPMVWQLALNLLIGLLQVFAVHVSMWSFL